MENSNSKTVENIKAKLETVFAIELLEYHDKNHLSGDNKTRNEEKQKLLTYAIGDCLALKHQLEMTGK